MRSTVKAHALFVVLVVAVVATAPASAQQWTAEQQEVWRTVEQYWGAFAGDDAAAFIQYVHDDYMGWDYDTPLPSGKASTERWMNYTLPLRHTELYEIQPAAISVHGDLAVVHYYYTVAVKNEKGEHKSSSGRWTDILVKDGGSWKLFADHGGQVKEGG